MNCFHWYRHFMYGELSNGSEYHYERVCIVLAAFQVLSAQSESDEAKSSVHVQ